MCGYKILDHNRSAEKMIWVRWTIMQYLDLSTSQTGVVLVRAAPKKKRRLKLL
jgi:hypothetical protein